MHDIVIIGAGTAGCVLAERLTASGRLRVLLVEAGGRPASRFVSIPAAFPKLFKSELDWAFECEPQAAVGGRRIFTPRGKMLGGSANMNAQMHQWCHPADFDGWVAAGATGWGWDDVAPVFRAQERLADGHDDPLRGRDGPMRVAPNRNVHRLTPLFIAAARKAGLGDEERYNGRAYQGAWIAELAHHNGKRFSAYDAYLLPAMRRKNLEVLSDAHVTAIVFDAGRAAGVRVRLGEGERLYPAGGVILAAGAYGSPQLLMLSGIGPASALQQFGIPVRVDSPDVGQNLQDHPVMPMSYRTRARDTMKNAESPLNLLRYLFLKRGMLASNGVEAFAFTQVHPGPVAAPDLELMFLPLEVRAELLEPPSEHAFCITPAVVAPRSRGRVFLKNADPHAPPGIDFGLLSDPEGVDRAVLLAGARLSRKIAATEPLAAETVAPIDPDASVESDQEYLDYASKTLQTVYHPTGTCRMGSDACAVVDPQLRVRGVERLWVADASVMPSVPRGHPNAVVAMIAERAAAMVGEVAGASR